MSVSGSGRRKGNCLVRSTANRNVPDQILFLDTAAKLDSYDLWHRKRVLQSSRNEWSSVRSDEESADDLTEWRWLWGHHNARPEGVREESWQVSLLTHTLEFMNYELAQQCVCPDWQGPLCLLSFSSLSIVGPLFICCLRWDKTGQTGTAEKEALSPK